ncbi:MAG: NAD(P)/FAD-dependent oxidoreductase, partial [Lachnospiraceae bacterium]|nr:NAD(P)/FAD-dependent oxidoreductase [Lachnospiraceae bacterium]
TARTINEKEMAAMASLIKDITMTVNGTRGFAEAVVTRGGVSVKEIDPSTMEAKAVPGLYFAGEVIDVDALTGGFNLQIAWSTGHLAGQSAAESNGD